MFRSLLLIFLLAACNSVQQTDSSLQNEQPDTVDKANNQANTSGLQGCYISASDMDSATMKLNIAGNNVTGELKYNRYQKDKNYGMLEGIIKDSLIIADYTFQSEGMVSVREVVFKISSGSLIEGFGDIVMKGDTARFNDKTRLSFHDDHPFVKRICQ